MEYITGGGMRKETIPQSLACEGEIMLGAVLRDLLDTPIGVELVVMRDSRLASPLFVDRVHTVWVDEPNSFQSIWKAWICQCDAIWPIAPENNGILEQLCLDVENVGKWLLTSPSVAVRLAASKLATVKRLAKFGLPVVPSLALDGSMDLTGKAWVVKPDDGLGCEDIHIIRDQGETLELNPSQKWVVQPLLKGDALSLSVLLAAGKARLLTCNRQHIVEKGNGFRLHGVTVNALTDVDGRWQRLAEDIARAMPELWGYVGIDLMLTESGPIILEVNPRLTTSYAGLRLALGGNPAAWVINLLLTQELPSLSTSLPQAIEIDLGRHDVD
jgi:predicted ATP-grasp superfamily ATP-dependent carboligase